MIVKRFLFILEVALIIFVLIDKAEATTDKASDLLALDRQEFGALTKTEVKLFQAVKNGKVADYSTKVKEHNDPAGAEKWGNERLLKADRIAWLCTNPQASALVTHLGIFINGARIDGELDLSFAKIPFPIFFVKSAFPEGIGLISAKIRALFFLDTHIGPINANGLKVEGSVFLRGNGFKAEGGVDLLGASIGGDLACSGGQFINKGAKALNADRLKVEGSVYLGGGFKAEGEVDLVNASIGGDLVCNGGQFINKGPKAPALNADRLKVEGSVVLGNGFKAEGGVDLFDASIGGMLNCRKGQFIHREGYALSANGLKVEGSVYLRGGFKAEGKVRLLSASIEGHFVLTGVVSPAEMTLDLRSAKLGTLWDDSTSWPTSGKLFLHGLVYNNIHDNAPTNAQTRIDWLHRQPARPFQPQPYEQLAAVFRKSGRDKDAKKILIQKNKDRARFTQLTWSEKCWDYFIGILIGYGYRPWRAFWIGLVVVLVGRGFFKIGLKANVMIPTKKDAYVSINEVKICQLSDDYPKFNPLMYSLDMFVPLIDLHQASYWLPNANQKGEWLISRGFKLPIRGGFLRIYLWLHIIAGWTLTTLLVVGLSGLIKS